MLVKHVAVLMGGQSAEREVSLASGKACASALRTAGYKVSEIEINKGQLTQLINKITPKPDAVFNSLHGRYGEDGCIQGLLELLQLPYTHSGVLASALAMDKPTALAMFKANGIQVPEGRVVPIQEVHKVFEAPYVIKPVQEGSSVGVIIVHEQDSRTPLEERWGFGGEALVEKFVPGRELTVAVMDNKAIGALEIIPKTHFYDYDAKYVQGASHHISIDEISLSIVGAAKKIALHAHQILGCRGVTRSDFRWDDSKPNAEGLYLLEINTQPGMTETSLVPEIAKNAGIDFPSLVTRIVEGARCGP